MLHKRRLARHRWGDSFGLDTLPARQASPRRGPSIGWSIHPRRRAPAAASAAPAAMALLQCSHLLHLRLLQLLLALRRLRHMWMRRRVELASETHIALLALPTNAASANAAHTCSMPPTPVRTSALSARGAHEAFLADAAPRHAATAWTIALVRTTGLYSASSARPTGNATAKPLHAIAMAGAAIQGAPGDGASNKRHGLSNRTRDFDLLGRIDVRVALQEVGASGACPTHVALAPAVMTTPMPAARRV
mmetsp:Transcript_120343/g.256899  ORF Transcript_120343/g.256899 Transcript_120343/m.256899 type:complete len:249 (-) Transcript_120343:131-877(-)